MFLLFYLRNPRCHLRLSWLVEYANVLFLLRGFSIWSFIMLVSIHNYFPWRWYTPQSSCINGAMQYWTSLGVANMSIFWYLIANSHLSWKFTYLQSLKFILLRQSPSLILVGCYMFTCTWIWNILPWLGLEK